MPKSWFEQVDSGEVKPPEKPVTTSKEGKGKSWFDSPSSSRDNPPSGSPQAPSSPAGGRFVEGAIAPLTGTASAIGSALKSPINRNPLAGDDVSGGLSDAIANLRARQARKKPTPVRDLPPTAQAPGQFSSPVGGGGMLDIGIDPATRAEQGDLAGAAGSAMTTGLMTAAGTRAPEIVEGARQVSPVVKAGVTGGLKGGVAALPEAARGMFYGSVGGKLLGGTAGAEIGAVAGGAYPLARGVVRGARSAMADARGLPPEGATTRLPKAILNQPSALPDSAPRVSPTLPTPKPVTAEPTVLQRGMEKGARLPVPSPKPAQAPAPEPSPLQRQMPTSAPRTLPMPKPIPMEETPPPGSSPQPEPQPSQPSQSSQSSQPSSPSARSPLPAAEGSKFPAQLSPQEAQGLSRVQIMDMIHGRGMEIGVTNESMMREWALDNYGLSLGNMEKPQLVNFYNQVLNRPGAPPVGPKLIPKGQRKFNPIPGSTGGG